MRVDKKKPQPPAPPALDPHVLRVDLFNWADLTTFVPVEMSVAGVPASCKRFVLNPDTDLHRTPHSIRLQKLMRITNPGGPAGLGGVVGPCALVTVVLFATTHTIMGLKHIGLGDHLLELEVGTLTRSANPTPVENIVVHHAIVQVIGTTQPRNLECSLSTDYAWEPNLDPIYIANDILCGLTHPNPVLDERQGPAPQYCRDMWARLVDCTLGNVAQHSSQQRGVPSRLRVPMGSW